MTDEQQLAKYRTLKQQNLPFDFYEEEEQERKRKEQERIAEEEKKNKTLPYYREPRNDNERLLNFQYEYKNGQMGALGKLYELSVTICKKYINTIANRNRKVKKLCMFDRETKAQDAASYLVEQYITREDFIIRDYVTAYLWLRVIKELFYHTKADEIVDYVDLADFYKEAYRSKGEGQIDQTRYLLWEEKTNK